MLPYSRFNRLFKRSGAIELTVEVVEVHLSHVERRPSPFLLFMLNEARITHEI